MFPTPRLNITKGKGVAGEYYYIKLMMGWTAVTSQPHPRVQIDTVAIICKTKGMKSGVDRLFFRLQKNSQLVIL